MDGSGSKGVYSLLVLLVITGHIGQAQDTCRTGCKSEAQLFKYAVGTTYKYNYDGKIEISLSSAEGQSTTTELKAVVLLTQLADCNQIIRLQNVQVVGQSGKKIPDIEKPIRINNNDGIVEDSICVVDGDNQNSINIKRAIASIFQASAKSGYETDIFGRCPTEYSSHKEGNVVVIQKSRDLNKCSFREHVQQNFFSTVLNLNSEIKSSPLLNGEYSATLRIKNGILDQATITENYLYIPFSVGKNGAKAQILNKLTYSGLAKDSGPALVTKPKSIIFENPHPVVAPSSNTQTLLNAVKEVAQTVDIVVGEKTAKEFINLLKIVRVSNKNDLLKVYSQVKSGLGVGDKDVAMRLYLDALLRSGNGDSVEALLELLDKKQLSEFDSKLTLISLNVARHVTTGSLKSATHLLDTPKLPREAYLGIGNLAGKFCQQHDCEHSAEVKALTTKLLSKIVARPSNKEQENDAIYALKALTNFHSLHDVVVPKLTGLASNKNIPNRVRVAALEAFLADPCTDKLRNTALQILQDIQQDSEVRIKAYLALAQCPNAKIGNEVKALLNKEPSIQVGGFITSHIHALRSSANPDKALAKKFLGFSIRKSFPIDPRKYSFNGEFSYAVDTLGIGASSEANIIYSQDSWLPRTSSLNLTAEIFGHSLNLLELQTRQENLDRLIEHYFGPNGVLRKSSLSNLVKEGKSSFHKLAEYVETRLKESLHRGKRDVSKSEMEQIAKQIHIKTNDLNKDLDLDVSLKTFGSEVFFLNINQEAKFKPEAFIDEIIAELTQGLDQLKKFEKTLRQNMIFLDAEIDYPTNLGFPLRLAVEGSANVQVKAEGQVDIRQLVNKPENGELRIKFIPSANIEVSGRLTLDALIVENGLKVVSSLHSSTGADLTASWNKNSGFDIKFGLPVTQQKVISADHEILFITREQAGRESSTPLKFTQVKDFSICFDQLSQFIGLTLCAEINGPNLGGQQIPILPFPLAGDAKFTISIENDDVSEFHIKNTLQDFHSDLIFETIGKDGKQKVALDLAAEYSPEKYIRAALSSPASKGSAEARIVLTNLEKALLLKVSLNEEEYLGKIGVSVSGNPERAIYKPLIEYRTSKGQQPLSISTNGQVIVERNGENMKMIFENLKVSDSQRQIAVLGNLGRESGIFFTDLTLSDNANKLQLEGRLQLTPDLIKFNIKEQNSIDSNANFNLQGEFKRQVSQYDVAIQLIHGPDLNSKSAILTITSSYLNKFKSSSEFRYETKNKISYPLLGISGKFELEQTPNTLDYDIEAQYGDLKLGSELEAKVNEKASGDYEIEFDLWGLDNKLELKSKKQLLSNDESKISNTIELNGKKFEVEGKIKHGIRPHNVDIGTELTVKIPTQAAPIEVNIGLKITQEELDAFSKIGSGTDHIIDAFLKANRNGDANGSIKVSVKNILSVAGQIHSNSGSGNGEVLVNLQNGKRQIKAETRFTLQPGHVYDITATIYPTFDKDKNAKIFLSTENKVSASNLNSKNNLDFLGHKLEVVAKGSKEGDIHVGRADGELEITLPGEQYLLLKADYEQNEVNELATGHNSASIEYRNNKNTPGRKYGYKGTWKNSNFEEGNVDVEMKLFADESNGKNINCDISLKTEKQGEQYQLNLSNKVTGTLLRSPLEVSISGHCTKGVSTTYEMKSSYGASNTLTINGDYHHSNEKRTGSLNIKAGLSSEPLKSLVIDLSGSLIPVVKEGDKIVKFQLDGKANVQAANSNGPIVNLITGGSINLGPSVGSIEGNLSLNQLEPTSVKIDYREKDNKQGFSQSAFLMYGKDNTIKYEISLEKSIDHQYKLTGSLQTPVEGYKNSQFSVITKRSKDGKDVSSKVDLTVDEKKWTSDTELSLSEISPVVNIQFTGPQGKVNQIFVKATKATDRQFVGEIKLVSEEKSFTFDGSINVNVENIENFIVKGQLHSPILNLNKISFDAHNKGTANDHKIQVVIKTNGKNYISGNLAYNAKEENGKFIVDGSGNFKVKDESKSGNFKYIIEKLSTEKNGEEGVQISFDAALGDKAIDSEYKITNKHFRLQESYCEQKKECAFIEVDNKVNSNDFDNFNQVLEINLDLRKLGLTHEFGLKAVTNRKQWIIDHTVDAHFQNQDNSKYQYSFYMHPTNAGITLTTPKRIIALEGKVAPPKNFREGGKSSGEVVFYLDKKNHPNKKTALSWSLDVDLKGKIVGDSKFSHPGLKKALTASFRATRDGTPYNGKMEIVAELDVFAQENQKLMSTYHKSVSLDERKTKGTSQTTFSISSTGLGVDIQGSEVISGDRIKKEFTYDSKLTYKAGNAKYENEIASKWSPLEISGILKVLNKILLKGDHKIQIVENDQIIESEISSYNNEPVISRLEINNFNTLAYSIYLKNEPNKKLLFNAGLIRGQIADIRAEFQNDNNKVNLFYATVKLDDTNYLKPDHKVDSKAIQDVIEKLRASSTSYFNGLETLGKEWAREVKDEAAGLGDLAKKAAPQLQPLHQYYSKELQEIKEEVLNDKSIKELGNALRDVLGSLITSVSQLFKKISQLTEEAAIILQNSFQSIVDTIEKELAPQLQEITSQIMISSKQILETVWDISLGILAKASQILEKYQPELQDLATTFSELFQDIGRLVLKAYDSTQESLENFIGRISSELKASPYLGELKEQYKEFLKNGFPSADAIINTIREIFTTIMDIVPGDVFKQDVSNILDLITIYLEKKLKNQPVDDVAALAEIGRSAVSIVRKVASIINAESLQVPNTNFETGILTYLGYLKNLPRLVAIKFSPLTYVIDHDSATEMVKLILALVNSPRNLFPPFPLFAIITQGNIFTFDGNHFIVPGKCNYLFSRDAVNGNFTLAGSYKNGQLASITLADEFGSITLVQGGNVKFNTEIVDLPLRKPTLAVWRDYEVINLLSTAGVLATCTPDLIGCSIKVSGFYHGQVRGLLGNGNSEPYDDFIDKSGKIVTAIDNFANSYKLTSSCATTALNKVETIPDQPACSKLFGWDSSLKLCYPFVLKDNFKIACAHGLTASIKRTEEAIAKAYVAACQERNIPIHVPENLVKCTNGDKPYNVGDTFSVKLPSKAADIVVIVESTKSNQDIFDKLVKTLIPEISTELRGKGVKDIEYHLITYGGLNQWPSHITVNGKLTFKENNLPSLEFGESSNDDYDIKQIQNAEIRRAVEELKEVLHDLSLVTGMNLKAKTYDVAHQYPFRVNALKSIIVVNAEACEVGKLYPLQKLFAHAYKNHLISLNLFTPLKSLEINTKKKDIVGFNDHSVFSLSQAKKNPKGSSELYKELNYNDYCVDFTIENRGNAFINDQFLSLTDAEQKQFVKLAASNIAEQLVNIEQGLDCTCKLISPWTAVNKCTESYSKDRLSKRV